MNDLFSILNIGIIVGTIILYLIIDKTFKRIIKKHNNLTNKFLSNLSKTLLIIISILTISSQYEGLSKVFSSLLQNSALLVAVLGFILQNTIKNTIAGLLLLSSEAFKTGDRIKIHEKELTGTIETLTLRHTIIKLITNERAIIPNSLMNEAIVINNNIIDFKTCYPLSIEIKSNSDISKAISIMNEEILKNPYVINKEALEVNISHVKSDVIELKALVWTNSINESFKTLSNIKKEIIINYQKEHIY